MTIKKGLIIFTLFVALSSSSLICSTCQSMVKGTAKTVSFLIPNFLAIDALEILCNRKYDSEILCKKVGQELAPLAISSVIEGYLNPDRLCSFACNNSFIRFNPDTEVERILSGGQARNQKLSGYVENREFKLEAKQCLKILHVSDIHQDKNYVEKSSISCQYPICCHSSDGFPQNINSQAKPFGSKNCDSPPRLFESFLKFISEQSYVDIVIATGDYSAHNQWEKTDQSILITNKQIQNKIMASFPNSILIKTEGNNDYSPDHQYDASKKPTLIQTTKVMVGEKELTFVALNTMAFDDMNLYLLGDQSYAIFQLIILQQILSSKQSVYLMGHIPPTLTGVAVEYGQVFRALVTKYSTKIKGQFYGHTHSDQITVNTQARSARATGFGFVCPSISPLFIGTSRSRIYKLTFSQESNGVNDYTQYQMKNLNASQAEWKAQYSFRQKYHLPKDEAPLTLKQIQVLKTNILDSEAWQQKTYLRATGLNKEYNDRSFCWIHDDAILRRKCFGKPASLNDKLYDLLDIVRGKWGYKTRLVSSE